MHGIPPGFPFGIPGINEEIDGTMQQAPHLSLHVKSDFIIILIKKV
jgi:hypothetical protein